MIKHLITISLLGTAAFSAGYNIDLYAKGKVKNDPTPEISKVEIQKHDKDNVNNLENIDKSELFTIKSFIKANDNYDWIIDPDLFLEKEYRYSTFKSNDWQEIIKEIAEYEDLIVKINNEQKIVKLHKKIKTKVEIQHLPQEDVEAILNKLKLQYDGVEIYKFKNVIYIEGERTSIDAILDNLKLYNEEVVKSMKKYVVNVYKTNKVSEGLTPMIDLFNAKKVNKVVLKNPKINKGYLINLGNKQLIIKINSNNVEINGATLDKSDLKYYGYSIDDWFVEIKPVQI